MAEARGGRAADDDDFDLDQLAQVYVTIAKAQGEEVAATFAAEALAAEVLTSASDEKVTTQALAAEATEIQNAFAIVVAESDQPTTGPIAARSVQVGPLVNDFIDAAESLGSSPA